MQEWDCKIKTKSYKCTLQTARVMSFLESPQMCVSACIFSHVYTIMPITTYNVCVITTMMVSHLQVFGVFVKQHLHIESLLFLCSAGDDFLLRCGRHLCPQLQQDLTESLNKRREKRKENMATTRNYEATLLLIVKGPILRKISFTNVFYQ